MPLMPAYHRAPTTLITELDAGGDQTPTVAFALGLVARVQAPRYRRAGLPSGCLALVSSVMPNW